MAIRPYFNKYQLRVRVPHLSHVVDFTLRIKSPACTLVTDLATTVHHGVVRTLGFWAPTDAPIRDAAKPSREPMRNDQATLAELAAKF